VSELPPDPEALLEQSSWLARLARGLVRDANAADDLVQETWFAAWKHGPPGKATDLRAWMSVVARNFARRSRRDAGLRKSHEPRGAREERFEDPGELAERVELQQRLAAAMLALDEPLRSALVLRYFDDLPTLEVAERLGVSHAAARQRISRGLSKLRERLDRDHEGGRAGWMHGLAALLPEPAAPVTGGLIIVGTKTKVALLVLLVALGVWLWTGPLAPGTRELRSGAQVQVPLTAGGEPETKLPFVAGSTASGERVPAAAAAEVANAEPATETNLLRGIVLDPANHPVEGAVVSVSTSISFDYSTLDLVVAARQEQAKETRSSADGRFALELDPTCSYQVTVEKSGCAPATFRPRRTGETMTVRLAYGASLEGHVTHGEARTPLSGAHVNCFSNGDTLPHGARFDQSTETDTLGFYRFDALPPGTLYVTARAPGEPSSGWIEVRSEAGKSVVQDIHLLATAWVRGVVQDAATHAPIAGAELSTNWSMRHTVASDASGSFSLPVDPSLYVEEGIFVRAPGYGLREVAVPSDARANGAEGLHVLLEPSRKAGGRVTDAQGMPIAGAYVAACAYEYEPRGGQRFDWVAGATDTGGRYSLSDLRADLSHSLFVRAAGFGSVSYEFPASEISGLTIELPLVVLQPAGSISGRIVDEKQHPLPDLEVSLHGINADHGEWHARSAQGLDFYLGRRTGRTDDRGRFTFDELASGAYDVELRRDSHQVTTKVPVVLGPGERRAGVELVVEHGVPISGRVHDHAGEGVRSIDVSIEPTAPGLSDCDVRTDDEGRFLARGLVPGKYRILLWPKPADETRPDEKFFAPTRFNDVDAGGGELDLEIEEGAWLTGTVVEADGSPLANASVLASESGTEGGRTATTDAKGAFRLVVLANKPLVVTAHRTRGEGFPRLLDPVFGRVIGALGGGPPVEIRMPAH
jgi:RNA polymerase sigma factor (sigma-70 family)